MIFKKKPKSLKIGDIVDLEGPCEVVAKPEPGVTVFEPVVKVQTMNISLFRKKRKVKVIKVRRDAKIAIPKGQYIDFYI
ncbi:MAG: hypothetical protein ACFFG0_04150 [Candidatus Thorarchaeota archaeon]